MIPKEIYQADIILKVEPPTIEEIEMMKGQSNVNFGTYK